MKALKDILEMARLTKAQIKDEKDELLYKAQQLKGKAGRLKKQGRDDEAKKALEEAEKYKKMAAEWKPKEKIKERTVAYYKLYWERGQLLGGGRTTKGSPIEGCLRDLFMQKLEFIENYIKRGEGPKKPQECLQVYSPGDVVMPPNMRDFGDLLDYCARPKAGLFFWYNWDKIKEVVIEIREDDEALWRYKGETAWRELPRKNNFVIRL